MVLNQLNREQLLQKINDICIDPIDAISLDDWNSLSLDQLRTVVALLTDGDFTAMYIPYARRRTRSRRGHCFLIEGLVQHLLRNPNMTNPMTGRPITERQRRLVNSAYHRITGRQSMLPAPGGGGGNGNVVYIDRQEVVEETYNGVSTIFVNGTRHQARDVRVIVTTNHMSNPTRVTRQIVIRFNNA